MGSLGPYLVASLVSKCFSSSVKVCGAIFNALAGFGSSGGAAGFDSARTGRGLTWAPPVITPSASRTTAILISFLPADRRHLIGAGADPQAVVAFLPHLVLGQGEVQLF